MKKVIVVVGPTSVGKTKMGVELARKYNGEVISGDSMQIYKHMDIGTAKVTQDEMKGVVHHLIDIKEPDDSYSVKDFQQHVRNCINDIVSRNKMPIIVGGTGLYIKAALYDYEFDDEEVDHNIYKERFKDYSNEDLFKYLESIDQKTAQTLHYNNRQRVIRAIEIFETTGKSKSEQIEKQNHELLYDAYFVGLTLPRDVLYERINHRVDQMVDEGLIEEIQNLSSYSLTAQNQSMKAIGYKEWFDYFNGVASKEEVIEKIKKNSRNYAKRQYTWFNNQVDVHWFDVNLGCFNETIQNVERKINMWIGSLG